MLHIFRRVRVVAEAVFVANAVIAVMDNQLGAVILRDAACLLYRRALRVMQARRASVTFSYNRPCAVGPMCYVDVLFHNFGLKF